MLYCRIFALRAHLRNSPPSLLIIGNNSLKQLAFGARANSPAPIGRSSNYHNPECSRCARRIMLFLKVVMVVSKSQYGWVKNADAPSPCALLRCSRHLRTELREPTDCAMRTRELLVPVELRIRFPHRLEPPVPREVKMVVGVFERGGKRPLHQWPVQRLVADVTLPPRPVLGILDRILQQVKFLRRLTHMKLQQIEIQQPFHFISPASRYGI